MLIEGVKQCENCEYKYCLECGEQAKFLHQIWIPTYGCPNKPFKSNKFHETHGEFCSRLCWNLPTLLYIVAILPLIITVKIH